MSAVKLALTARRLRSELADADLLQSEPIAIVGLGCRFPGGASTPHRFWRLLETGTDAVREIPPERWDINTYYDSNPAAPAKMNTRWAGLLDQVDQFDAEFFGIAPREAAALDPQQRLLLEVTCETLNDAGYPPETLSNSPTGVFFAIYNSDYSRLQFSDPLTIGAHTISGTSHGVAAGRLSYLLNLNGPSMAIDTACSSSLVAVHLACQSLRSGECSLAVAGGVSVLISPEETVSLSKWGMLAPDGRCKTFDASANGFVRGEGCGVIALRRLADALASGDRIYAVIRGSAVNQDGRSTVLTAPNGLAQQAVLRQALKNARVRGDQLSYVEAHGTGTALGDPIEIEALAAVVGQPRLDGSTCRVGSVKTNLGHLEAAAGVAGLIKVALAMRHQTIPPHLHFTRLNPLISLDQTCLVIGRNACPWPSGLVPRFAGVSSFGFGGTNAHIVLEEAPSFPARKNHLPNSDAGPWLLPISARDERALVELVHDYSEFLADGRSEEKDRIRDICYTAGLRRWHHPVRAAFVGKTSADLAEHMRAYLEETARERKTIAAGPGKLAFVFSGHGSQWVGMGCSLLESEPAFAKAIRECDSAVRSMSGWSVLEAMAASADNSRLNETEVFQPVLFAIQTALAALWRSWGIVPEAVIGHSVGEIAAAHVAGAIKLEDAAKIAVLRGKLIQTVAGKGAMAAVEISPHEAAELIFQRKLEVTVAAVNAPNSITLSGRPDALDQFLAEVAERRVEIHRLNVSCAFHSPFMESAAETLEKALSGLRPADTSTPIFSTVEGRVLKGREFGESYWRRNVREPVQFAAAATAAVQAGYSLFLEVSPHPVLGRALSRCVEACGESGSAMASMRRGQDGRVTLLNSLGSLYTLGKAVDWKGLYSDGGCCLSLPPYPWQRERHWITPSSKSSTESRHQTFDSEWPGHISRSAFFDGIVAECVISSALTKFVDEHRISGIAVVPVTAVADLALNTAANALGTPNGPAKEPMGLPRGEALVLEGFAIDKAILLQEKEERVLQLGFKSDGSFQLFSKRSAQSEAGAAWTQHAAGSVRLVPLTDIASGGAIDAATLDQAKAICNETFDVKLHYTSMQERGIEFGPLFRRIKAIWRGEQSVLAQLNPLEDAGVESTTHIIHPATLDACLQAIAPVLPDSGAYLPRTIERLWLSNSASARWSFARLRDKSNTAGDMVIADVWIFDEAGKLIGVVRGIRLQRSDVVQVATLNQTTTKRPLYEICWEEQPLKKGCGRKAPNRAGRCLVFADSGGIWKLFRERAEQRGVECLLVRAGDGFRHPEERLFDVTASNAEDFRCLLLELRRCGLWPLQDVVHFWNLDQPKVGSHGVRSLTDEQVLSIGSVLNLVRAMNADPSEESPRLWLVSRSAVPLPGQKSPLEPTQAPLWGLGHAISLEHPELRCTKIDLQGDQMTISTPVDQLCDELYTGSDDREDRVVLANGRRFVARLRPLGDRSELPARPGDAPVIVLHAAPTGILEDLEWRPGLRRAPAANEVEIEVIAAGLNFRDVLTTLSVVPGNRERLGGECSGRVVSVGHGVTQFKIGDEVIAFALGGFASYVTVSADFVIHKPNSISLDRAAALPVAFLTALYAFRRVATLRAGQKVLIHAATGGVGSAAVQLAKLVGAEIFGTAGSPEKRTLLKSWGVQHVFDSRDLSFADAIRTGLGERGIDVVLNSLAGEFVTRSLELVRPGGLFIELGKRDLLDPLEVLRRHGGVAYSAFDLAEVAEQSPDLIQSLFSELKHLLESKQLAPLPVQVFPAQQVAAAFRYMARGSHTGKIVIGLKAGQSTSNFFSRSSIAKEGVWVITGGLGGLGMSLVEWLVNQGITRLALISRSAADGPRNRFLETLRSSGISAQTFQADVSDEAQLKDALAQVRSCLGPIRGVVHAAGTVDDGTVTQLDWSRCLAVLAPKMDGAWNLHKATAQDELDAFVLFSSAASVLGSPGQGNYCAANAFLDALAHYRHGLGLPAVSVNWSVWAVGGMVANLASKHRERLAARGLETISVESGFAALGEILDRGIPQAAVIPADWSHYVQALPYGASVSLLEDLLPKSPLPDSAAAPNLVEELNALPLSRRVERIRQLVESHAGRALGLTPGKSIDLQRPLHELGLDSLMSVELRNSLASAFGRSLSATLLFDYPTLESLTRYLAKDVLNLEPTNQASSETVDTANESDLQELQNMSESEAESLLLAELNQLKESGV